MSWAQLYYNEDVKTLITASEADGGLLDAGHKADLARAIEYLEAGGPRALPTKLSKAMGDGLLEFRLSGVGGEARIFYCFAKGKRIWHLHAIEKKSQRTPKQDLKLAQSRMKEVLEYEAQQEQRRKQLPPG